MGALVRAIDEASDSLSQTFVPKRLIADIRDIWYLQGRLLNRRGKKPAQALRHGKFRAGYDFLELRGIVGEVPQELVDWWTQFQEIEPEARESWLEHNNKLGATEPKKRVRRRPRKKRNTTETSSSQ
jgi:poly(A) polymerase